MTPADPKDRYLVIGHRTLAIHFSGPLDGTPVVFFHGTPGTRLDVRLKEDVLHSLGVRLISYDRPGYGLSDEYPGRSIVQAADDVRVLVDALEVPNFAVIGRSGGAPYALAVAASMPDRVTRAASIVGLAPIDGSSLVWLDGMLERNRVQYTAAIEGREDLLQVLLPEVAMLRNHPQAFAARWFGEAPKTDRQMIASHSGALLSSMQYAVQRSAEGWVTDNLAVVRPWGFDPCNIRVPTLIWHGLQDVFAPPAHSRWLAGRIPAATIVLDEHASHLQVPAAQIDALGWLVSD